MGSGTRCGSSISRVGVDKKFTMDSCEACTALSRRVGREKVRCGGYVGQSGPSDESPEHLVEERDWQGRPEDEHRGGMDEVEQINCEAASQ